MHHAGRVKSMKGFGGVCPPLQQLRLGTFLHYHRGFEVYWGPALFAPVGIQSGKLCWTHLTHGNGQLLLGSELGAEATKAMEAAPPDFDHVLLSRPRRVLKPGLPASSKTTRNSPGRPNCKRLDFASSVGVGDNMWVEPAAPAAMVKAASNHKMQKCRG